VLAAGALAAAALLWPAPGGAPGAPSGLRVAFLDVGQGDAILLQPPSAPAVLVDTGPPGDGLASLLREFGVGRLGAVVVTHDQSDHAGGIGEALGTVPVGALAYGWAGEGLLGEAARAGVPARRVAAGSRVRTGALRLSVLWPPRALLDGAGRGEDPNRLALVMLARWRHFSLLLTADAEAEAVPLPPAPVDVLKVAHHGSEDTGLAELLAQTRPRLAVISVGEDNSYGHPSPATLSTLAAAGVEVMRTDRDGTIVLEVGRRAVSVGAG
jgi:competence protein ComEC